MERFMKLRPLLVQIIQDEEIGQAPWEIVDLGKSAATPSFDLLVKLDDGVHRCSEAGQHTYEGHGDCSVPVRLSELAHRHDQLTCLRG
jgi:hypothetical protein